MGEGAATNIKAPARRCFQLRHPHPHPAHAPTPPTRKPHITSQHSKHELHDKPIDMGWGRRTSLCQEPKEQKTCSRGLALPSITRRMTPRPLLAVQPRASALAASDHLHQIEHTYWERVPEAPQAMVSSSRRRRHASSIVLTLLLLLALAPTFAHASFWGRRGGAVASYRHGGRRSSPTLAFLGAKKKPSGLNLPSNNGTTSTFLTTGSSVLHIHNSNVTLLSLDSGSLPARGHASGNLNNTNGGVVSSSSGAGSGRSLTGGPRGAGAGVAGQNGNAFDQLANEAMQTIGGALFEAMCFYIAGRIIMGVRGLWGKRLTKPTGVKFSDVIGVDEAKQEVQELVEYLKEPMRYKILGAKIPRGILLVGPPGVGKTMLARAIAGEANCPFYYASGSDFANPYWGEFLMVCGGRKRKRDFICLHLSDLISFVFFFFLHFYFTGMGVQKIKKLFQQARRSKVRASRQALKLRLLRPSHFFHSSLPPSI